MSSFASEPPAKEGGGDSNGNSNSVDADQLECKCNTCKAIFSSIDKVKEHYRSEWHIFNAKRRANSLIPLTRDEFKKVKPMIQKSANGVAYTVSAKTSEDRKEEDISAPRTGGVPGGPTRVGGTLSSATALNPILPAVAQASNVSTIKSGGASAAGGGSGDVEGDGDAEEESVNEVPPLPSAPNISIFDNVEFDTVDECVDHMAMRYRFFIPDIECLEDREGFLQYLSDKVKLGGYCLYCQKMFQPGRPCQNHMISKDHCKVAYEEGVDLDEYEDFYDYSSTYDENTKFDEEGNPIDIDLRVTDIGELMLPSGKILGHRMYRRYYSQRVRSTEVRPSVIAAQREELLRLQCGRGYGGKSDLAGVDVEQLSDVQVMSMLVEKQKLIRKNLILQQRSQLKQEWRSMRNEYKSNADKLRSKATTTEKIHDYHGILM